MILIKLVSIQLIIKSYDFIARSHEEKMKAEKNDGTYM